MGKTLCTRIRESDVGSYGVGTWTRRSKNRTPFLSCSLGFTAWHRTDGGALWHVGALCVPGILRAPSGVLSASLLIHLFGSVELYRVTQDCSGR